MDTVNERASENMKSGARNGEGSERARERKPRKAQTSGKKNTSKICQKKPFNNAVKPVEEAYKFGSFFSACLTDSDFDAKPSVLLLGQYSTGKTTFIEHLLGRKYPGANIGPEPSTDRVVAISHALEDRRTPGATLAVNPSLAWSGLAAFGNSFLARFEGAGCHAPSGILRHMTLVDTPGILSGEKQRIARSFDFVEVCSWFAARCDLILLLFDPAKLDVSDEFKEVITALRGHDDKVRVVLNKADSVDMQQLMRVYGALLWSLAKGEWREGKEWVGGWGSERARGREEKEKEEKTKKKCWKKNPKKLEKQKTPVFRSPEVCRVYVGSFNAGKPPRTDVNPTGAPLFKAEAEDLMSDLVSVFRSFLFSFFCFFFFPFLSRSPAPPLPTLLPLPLFSFPKK
jgi:EH domain-containing protein 1